jgi:lipoprotein-releasing system ATP-binding protein
MSLLIEADHLTRILPATVPVTLVRDVSLTVDEHEFIAITGPSGSGKSSLLYLLGLLDRPTSGTLRIAGQDTSAMNDDALARLRLGMLGFVFQFHFLLPEFSVLENVTLPMRKAGHLSSAAMRDRAAMSMSCVSGWPLHGRWPTIPMWFWRTSRPAASTARARSRCSRSFATS